MVRDPIIYGLGASRAESGMLIGVDRFGRRW